MADIHSERFRINSKRLWNSLMDMAKIGVTKKGGVCRPALTDLDRQARDLFVKWCHESHCHVTVDRIGNIFARRPGKDKSLPPIMTGSYLDTQPTGGRFDGAYGVMAGLEVVRTLNDLNYKTLAPIEVVVWTNEEGSRFAPWGIGSAVFAGAYTLKEGLSCKDVEGRTIGEELKRIGYAGRLAVSGHPVAAFLEAHIEQGPVLEKESKTIGVVSGVLGLRWYDLSVIGRSLHAGTAPAKLRRDALVGAARIIMELNSIGNTYQPNSSATVGELHVYPNSRNVIPEKVNFTVDLRHSEVAVLDAMENELKDVIKKIMGELKLKITMKTVSDMPPTSFAKECIEEIRDEAEGLGLSYQYIKSGTGHDTCYIARVAPTGMIFIPCKDGISHNEKESAKPDDIAAGCNVLLRTIIRLADGKGYVI